jgi:hypothetical protein
VDSIYVAQDEYLVKTLKVKLSLQEVEALRTSDSRYVKVARLSTLRTDRL